MATMRKVVGELPHRTGSGNRVARVGELSGTGVLAVHSQRGVATPPHAKRDLYVLLSKSAAANRT